MSISACVLSDAVKMIVVLILFALTIQLPSFINQYEISGDELLVNSNFDSNFDNWHKTGDVRLDSNELQNVIQLKSESNKKVAIKQVLIGIQDYEMVRLGGTIKVENVGHGDYKWQAARIILVSINEDGQPIFREPHVLVSHNGTADWERFSKIFYINSYSYGYHIEIQLLNVKGVMLVKDIDLYPVKETLLFKSLQSAGILLWIVITLWLIVPYLKIILTYNLGFLAVVLVFMILIGVLMPLDLKNNFIILLKLILPWLDDEEKLFRLGHFFIFCALAIVVYGRNCSRHHIINRAALLILFAMFTENVQFIVDGRTPKFLDFFVDISGMILGFLLSKIYLFYKYNCTGRQVG